MKHANAFLLVFILFLAAAQRTASAPANDFAPNDLGNNARVRGHPSYTSMPQAERDYYEDGLPQFNHDGVGGHDANGNGVRDAGEAPFDRGDVAAFCARYNRGGAPDAAVPAPPATADQFKDLMEKIKQCVDDLLQPDKDPQNDRDVPDDEIIDFINGGQLGIGNPMTAAEFTAGAHDGRDGFVCINHARFFASLLRELGFPTRDVNVPLSKMVGGMNKYVYQEAAVEVWFNGRWYYFDAYLTTPGNPAAETSPDGLLGGSITDRTVHVTRSGTTDYGYEDDGTPEAGSGWEKAEGPLKNPDFDYYKLSYSLHLEQTMPGVALFVTNSAEMGAGWTPDLEGQPAVPDSLVDLFLNPALTGARLDIARSAFLPYGVDVPETHQFEEGAPVSATNETVVLNYPADGVYCAWVWDRAGAGGPFELLVSAEGIVQTELPPVTAGQLEVGEVRQVACGDVRLGSARAYLPLAFGPSLSPPSKD